MEAYISLINTKILPAVVIYNVPLTVTRESIIVYMWYSCLQSQTFIQLFLHLRSNTAFYVCVYCVAVIHVKLVKVSIAVHSSAHH